MAQQGNQELPEHILKIQETVVGMYSEHPWPLNQDVNETMGWRLKCLGIKQSDYQEKQVLDMGCGTGEYALWYAQQGAGSVTGIDLSDGSLHIANQRRKEGNYDHAEFLKMDILNCSLPNNHFDYSYSVGVLHHTGDPLRGFRHLVRVTKPGGVIIVSLYSKYSRRVLRMKQTVCKWLGGDDLEKRVQWGERLFKRTMDKLDKRYHGLKREQVGYDIFGFPHESLHTAGEVLKWFDETGVDYIGSFAPLRIRDYLYAFDQPEYQSFRRTFDAFPTMRWVADGMTKLAKTAGPEGDGNRQFPRPGPLSRAMSQSVWVPFGLRFNCFTMAGIKV
jgi:ubiquinone/menaquinone biosynthesis C-methylase UbiE